MAYEDVPWKYTTCEVKFTPDELISDEIIMDTINDCISNQLPFSLIRIGDGELTVMSQDLALTQQWLRKNVAWYDGYDYCGVKLPDYDMRDKLIQSVKDADVIGVFPNDEFINRCFSAITFKPEKVCYAFANVGWCYRKKFVDLIKQYPPLLIGHLAKYFDKFIAEKN